jgi:hypothetical protein
MFIRTILFTYLFLSFNHFSNYVYAQNGFTNNEIFLRNAPGVPFTLTAAITLPDEYIGQLSPYKVQGPDDSIFDTQWHLISDLKSKSHYELSANITQAYQGDVVFKIIYGASSLVPVALPSDLLPLVNGMALEIIPQHGNPIIIPIDVTKDFKLERLGPARVTVSKHLNASRVGVHLFMDYKAHSQQIDLTFKIHNALLPAQPKFYFRSIRLLTPQDYSFKPHLPQQTIAGDYLVTEGLHLIRERGQISFRLAVAKNSSTIKSPTYGIGMQNYTKGNYLHQDYMVGNIPNSLQNSINWTNSRINLLATNKNIDAKQPIPHPLYPAWGSQYGGMTGGDEIDQIPFSDIISAKNADAILGVMIQQIRYQARTIGFMYEANGVPINVENYANPDGSVSWNGMFSNYFKTQGGIIQDAPFFYSKLPIPMGESDYEIELNKWQNIDHQHLIRNTAHDKLLVWLLNDDLSKLNVTMTAELQRMNYWHGQNNFQAPLGRDGAWILDIISFAYSLNQPENKKLGFFNWIKKFEEKIINNQLPSGIIISTCTGKVTDLFGSTGEYCVGQSYEMMFFNHAMMGASQVLAESQFASITKKHIEGILNFGWYQNGLIYKVPTHQIVNGQNILLEFLPTEFYSLYIETYNIGTLFDFGLRLGVDVAPYFLANAGTTNLEVAAQKIKPSSHAMAHWASVLGIVQKIGLAP